MWLWFYLYEFNWQKWNEKKKLCCLIHCCHFAAVLKQLCDLCKKGRTVSSAAKYWLLCVLWCERAAITGGERRQAGGWGGGQQRDVLYILVYSQQLHLGEQEDPHCLHTQTYEFFPTHPLWTRTEMCDGSQWLPTSPSHHRRMSVTNQSFDVRQRGIRLQGPVWHKAMVFG